MALKSTKTTSSGEKTEWGADSELRKNERVPSSDTNTLKEKRGENARKGKRVKVEKGRERKRKEEKGRARKRKEEKGRERKRKEEKGRARKRKEDKGRERKRK